MKENEKVSHLLRLLVDWSKGKGLDQLTPLDQLPKLNSEFGELGEAYTKKDLIGIMDGIGDSLTVCTVMASQYERLSGVTGITNYYHKLKHFLSGSEYYDLHYQLNSFIEQAVLYFPLSADSKHRIEYIRQAYSRVIISADKFAQSQRVTLYECLNMALTTISYRSGEIVNGVFVKRVPTTAILVPVVWLKLEHEKLIEKINEYVLQNKIEFFKIEFKFTDSISHKEVV